MEILLLVYIVYAILFLLSFTKRHISKFSHILLVLLLVALIMFLSNNKYPNLHLVLFDFVEPLLSQQIIQDKMLLVHDITSDALVWLRNDYKRSKLRQTINTWKRKVIYFLNYIK